MVWKLFNEDNIPSMSKSVCLSNVGQFVRQAPYVLDKIGQIIETVVKRCSIKKVFLEISQNSQENTCAGLRPATLLK